MPRKKKGELPENPLLVGLSALIVVVIMTSLVFQTPLIALPTGTENVELGFSALGIPLLCLLVVFVLFVKVWKQ